MEIEKSLSTSASTPLNSWSGSLSRPHSPLIRGCNTFAPSSSDCNPTPLVRGTNTFEPHYETTSCPPAKEYNLSCHVFTEGVSLPRPAESRERRKSITTSKKFSETVRTCYAPDVGRCFFGDTMSHLDSWTLHTSILTRIDEESSAV
ncbi:hypothetical protein TNCV_540331 [Trichonephila clavipes]|nr:hypothetical protein TNCV_540331 [Trichonephila clavipes]